MLSRSKRNGITIVGLLNSCIFFVLEMYLRSYNLHIVWTYTLLFYWIKYCHYCESIINVNYHAKRATLIPHSLITSVDFSNNMRTLMQLFVCLISHYLISSIILCESHKWVKLHYSQTTQTTIWNHTFTIDRMWVLLIISNVTNFCSWIIQGFTRS